MFLKVDLGDIFDICKWGKHWIFSVSSVKSKVVIFAKKRNIPNHNLSLNGAWYMFFTLNTLVLPLSFATMSLTDTLR